MIEHDFADAIFNTSQPNDLPNAPTRDFIFKSVLDLFNGGPVLIFQVGGIETFDLQWRIYSGWSDTLFGQYIRDNGGELTVVDINMNSLAHSKYAASKLGYDVNEVYGDAIDHISSGYDIYYLDGSDDPQETFEQFKQIEHEDCVVLVDDFKIKGVTLKDYLDGKNQDYVVYEVANQVAVINLKKG